MVLSGAAGIGKLQRTKGKKECGILHKLRIVFYGYKVRGKQEPVFKGPCNPNIHSFCYSFHKCNKHLLCAGHNAGPWRHRDEMVTSRDMLPPLNNELYLKQLVNVQRVM